MVALALWKLSECSASLEKIPPYTLAFTRSAASYGETTACLSYPVCGAQCASEDTDIAVLWRTDLSSLDTACLLSLHCHYHAKGKEKGCKKHTSTCYY